MNSKKVIFYVLMILAFNSSSSKSQENSVVNSVTSASDATIEMLKNNGNTDLDPPLSEEEAKILDDMEDSQMKAEDVVLPNGKNMIEFLCEKDPKFIDDNYEIFGIKCKN